ncbi:MAG: bifunctional nuclease family protein [Thermoanaerobaculia bacterium]
MRASPPTPPTPPAPPSPSTPSSLEGDESWIQMDVKGLLLDPASETPVLLLEGVKESVVLPVWIGPVEANAIASALEGLKELRPMTHDLISNLLRETGVELSRVEIWALRDGTFYGRLCLQSAAGLVLIDSRPSDAIAIAVRTASPIFVARTVMDEALRLDLASEESAEDETRAWLEQASPEDLGKYKM